MISLRVSRSAELCEMWSELTFLNLVDARIMSGVDVYGTVADCYSDLGKSDKAKEFYDKYVQAMNQEDGLSKQG